MNFSFIIIFLLIIQTLRAFANYNQYKRYNEMERWLPVNTPIGQQSLNTASKYNSKSHKLMFCEWLVTGLMIIAINPTLIGLGVVLIYAFINWFLLGGIINYKLTGIWFRKDQNKLGKINIWLKLSLQILLLIFGILLIILNSI